MIKIAVVILSWNGSEMLQRFLPSVCQYSNANEVAVYVADNGSTDNTIAMLCEKYPEVRLIRLDTNHGFADGYNLALKEIEAEYFVLLNSDVEVTPSWLTPLVNYMDAHPEVAACQPKIRSWHEKDFFEYAGAAGGFLDIYGYPFCRGRIMSAVERDNGQYDTIMPVFWATGAALFIRSEDYRSTGGLDGRFFAHMEEIDLCWRLHARGRGVVCIPQSLVYHVGGGTLKKENPRKTFLNFRNNLVMLYKNVLEKDLLRIMRARFFLDHLAALQFFLKGQFPNAKAVLLARKEYYAIRKEFSGNRLENMEKTIAVSIPGQLKKSILVQFYVKGKRTFSKILFN